VIDLLMLLCFIFFREGMKSIAAQARLETLHMDSKIKVKREEEKSVSRGASLFDSRTRTVFFICFLLESFSFTDETNRFTDETNLVSSVTDETSLVSSVTDETSLVSSVTDETNCSRIKLEQN
jgi:hypothetical protein